MQHTFELPWTRDRRGKHTSVGLKQSKMQVSLTQKTGWKTGSAAKTVLKNVHIGTIRPHLEYGSTTLSSESKLAIYTLDKVQNQALNLIMGSMKYTPIRVMEETTAIQLLCSKRRDMRNIIQAERYKCSHSHPMRKRMDDMTKHRQYKNRAMYVFYPTLVVRTH